MIPSVRAIAVVGGVAAAAPIHGGVLPTVPAAEAQSLTNGVLEGRVTDGASGLGGVPVTLEEVDGPLRRVQRTEWDGAFRFELLPPGEYTLAAEQVGYRPHRKEGVRVDGGGSATVTIHLTEASPPVDETDRTVHRRTFPGSPGGGTGRRLAPHALHGLPPETGHWTEAARLVSSLGDEGGSVGMPAGLSGFAVDGLATPVPHQPGGERGALAGMAHPTAFFREIAHLDLPYDVEWRDGAGGLFHGITHRGTEDLRTRVQGTWSGAEVRDRPEPADGLPAHHDLEASAVVTGPILPDTADFAAGLHVRRHAQPLPAYLNPERNPDEELASALSQVAGNALEPFWSPAVVRWQTLALFGRADWQASPDHAVTARAHLGGAWGSDSDLAPTPVMGPGTELGGWDLDVAATLTSRLTPRLGMELRAGLGLTRRRHTPREFWDLQAEFNGHVPATVTASTGRVVGSNPLGADDADQRSLRVTETFHFETGNHRLKAGVGLAATHHSIRPHRQGAGVYRFGAASDLLAGEGAYDVQLGGEEWEGFNIWDLSIFAQDTWTPNPDLELTAGLRVDRASLPVDDVPLIEEWEAVSGMDNQELAASAQNLRVSPRLGFRWTVDRPGRWVVEGGAGAFNHLPDPGTLDESLRYTGDVEARRGLGAVGGWPDAPGDEALQGQGPTLAMLGPYFRGPRSRRASVGVRYLPVDHTMLTASASFNRVDHLPRRSDLNLRVEPWERDQFGRPLYGEVRKEGGLLAVRPGTDRRHSGFDVVSALEADGWSESASLTFGVQHHLSDLLEVSGSYTLSRTRDNRPGGGFVGAPESPAPRVQGLEDGWARGPSDLHARHQAVLVGQLQLPSPVPIQLGARYRGRSGLPFTPAFPRGVQAGGHVLSEGDPAYLADVAGVASLASEWGCLQDQLGGWAERNSCRGPSSHDLDVRVSLGVLDGDRMSAEVVLDAVNVLGRHAAQPDPALFLIDPVRDLSRHPGSERVTVPLQVNPHFGQPLFRDRGARGLRLGFSAAF